MTTLLKILFWGAVGLIVVAGGLYLMLLGVNRHDQPPSATAQEFRQALDGRPAVPDPDNAYLIMLRVSAGHQGYRASRRPVVEALVHHCGNSAAECFDAVDAAPRATALWLTDEAWLLEQYKTLIVKPAFLQAVSIGDDAPTPDNKTVRDGQRLFLISALLTSTSGKQLRAALDQDLAFWRMVLANSDLLITKLIATAAIKQHFEMGNEVQREWQARALGDTIPGLWRVAIDGKERSIQRPLIGEWRYMDLLIASIMTETANPFAENDDQAPTWLDRAKWRIALAAWQPQDFSNHQAAAMKRQIGLFDVPYASIPDALQASAGSADDVPWQVGGPYNLTGKVLGLTTYTDYGGYVVRFCDLEGIRRAALLTVSMRERKTAPDSIGAAVRNAELTNPYTGEPFAWSASTGEVVFVGLEDEPKGEHRFRY